MDNGTKDARAERVEEQRRTEEERQYRAVLNATGTTVFIYDVATGTYQVDLLATPSTAATFAGSALGDELIQKGVMDAQGVEAVKAAIALVAGGKQESAEHTTLLVTRSGERRWFRVRILRMDDQTPATRLLITANDINDQMEANAALRFRAERDALTGLYNREAFFERAAELIAAKEPGYYVMACFDIDNFKVINDQYGSDKGDHVLRYIADVFSRGFEKAGGVCCRVMADNFAVLYPRAFLHSQEIAGIRAAAARLDGTVAPITFTIGRYTVTDKTLPVSAMYDRASIAESSVKGRFDVRIADYTESMRERILREQEILNEMNAALETGCFELYLQPQYNHASGALIGSEALVRWRHPQKGLIPPYEFIPVFERNGFIYEMDKYVWEQACILLRRWLSAGELPPPMSVNVSRYDVFREDFFAVITELVERYAIPIDLLRLEITESAFAHSSEQIIGVVKRLTEYGFIIEIDDFGSGYSSFNTLKDVPASVLKLDMRFLEDNGNSSRGGNILESIVRMAKWLGMPVIAEGVETCEQADYLKSIGCNYVQGYLYARPMPIGEYERVARSIGTEARLAGLRTVANMDNDSFWDPKSMDTLIFNSFVGGACIFEYHNGDIELLRANDKYAQVIGSAGMTVAEALKLRWPDHLDEENRLAVRAALQKSIATGEEVAGEYVFLNLPGCPAETYLRTTLRVIASAGDYHLIYCMNENITAQRMAEKKEQEAEKSRREAAEQLRLIMDNINGGVSAVTIGEDRNVSFVFANDVYYAQIGYTREQLAAEVSDVFTLVHPDDRERVASATTLASKTGEPFSIMYRAIRRDGSIMHMLSNIAITRFSGIDQPVQIAVANDVTAQRIAEQKARTAAAQMQAIMQSVHGGVSAATLKNGEIGYVFVNDEYYAMFGFTPEEFLRECPHGLVDLIHPDDLPSVYASAEQTEEDGATRMEFRVRKRDGSVIWVRSNSSICRMESIEEPVHLAVLSDITNEKESAQRILETASQLRFLNSTARELLSAEDSGDAIGEVLKKILGYFRGARAYIVELDYASRLSNNTYEVCAPGVTSEKENLQSIPFEAAPFWFRAFEGEGYVNIQDVALLDESRAEEKRILDEQGIRSLVAVPLRRDGVLIGFVGVDDPSRQQSHIDDLKAIGDYLAVMLTRRDLTARIERNRETLQNMMNDMPGGYARMRATADGQLLTEYVNDGFCRLRGMTQEEILGHDREDAMYPVHPDDIGMVRTMVKEMLATGETRTVKYRLRCGDGSYVWLLVFGRISRSETGEIYVNAYFTELSEGERKELSFRETLPFVLKAVMESSTDLAFAKDANLRYLCASGAFIKMVGLASEADVVGKTDYELFGSEIANKYRADDLLLLQSGQSLIDMVEQIPSDDGVTHYSSTSKYVLRDTVGNVIGLYGVGRDITEYRESFARLKLLTDNIPGGLAMYELSPRGTRLLYFSDGYYSTTGYTKEEYERLAAADPMCLIFEEDMPVVRSQIAMILAGSQSFDYAYRARSKDGGYRWINLRGNVSERHDDTVVVNAVKFDVTEQRQGEERLRIREEEYRLAILHAGRLIYRYAHRDNAIDMPPDTAALFGLPTRIANMPQGVIDTGVIAPESLDVFTAFYQSMQRGDRTGSMTVRRRISDGGFRWFAARFSNIFDDDGKPVSAIIVFEDITEQRERDDETELLRQNERMFRTVAAHSNRRIYRYELATRTATLFSPGISRLGETEAVTGIPESLIERGVVLPESALDYRELHRMIHEGRPDGGARIHMCLQNVFCWMDMRYTTIYDDQQRPVFAVISLLDITDEHEKELAYERYRQTIIESAPPESLIYFETDLTANVVEREGGNVSFAHFPPYGCKHEDAVSYGIGDLIAEEARDRAKVFFSRERLFALFAEGTRSVSEDWPVMLPDGKRLWFRSDIEMIQDPYSGHIRAYILLRDVTEETRAALDVKKQAETDGMTGLYNKTTTEALIGQRLSKTDGVACALLIADLDDLKTINDNLGHAQGDRALHLLADALRVQFRHTDIVGRIGGDEFAVFLDGGGNEARLRSILLAFMRRLTVNRFGEDGSVTLHASIGAAIGVTGKDTYESLFRRADKALYHVKRNGKSDFAVYTPEMEHTAYQYKGHSAGALWQANFFDREELDHLLRAVSAIYPMVISVNLTKNSYYMMQYDDYMTKSCVSTGVFDELISEGVKTFHPDDRASFLDAFLRENLLAAFSRGETVVTHEGRQLGDDGVYRCVRTDVIFIKGKDGDVLQITLARECDAVPEAKTAGR